MVFGGFLVGFGGFGEGQEAKSRFRFWFSLFLMVFGWFLQRVSRQKIIFGFGFSSFLWFLVAFGWFLVVLQKVSRQEVIFLFFKRDMLLLWTVSSLLTLLLPNKDDAERIHSLAETRFLSLVKTVLKKMSKIWLKRATENEVNWVQGELARFGPPRWVFVVPIQLL